MPSRDSNGRALGTTGRNPYNIGLPKIHTGQPLTANPINQIANVVDKVTIRSGVGYRVKQSSNGTTLEFDQPDTYSVEISPLTPQSFTVKNQNIASITAGTVNGIVPKINGAYIDASPTPTITLTQNGYILLQVTRTAGQFFPSDVSIIFSTTNLQSTDTVGYFPLGSVVINTKANPVYAAITPLNGGNMVVNRLKAGANTSVWYWNIL